MRLEVNVHKKFAQFSCSYDFLLSSDRCGVFGPSGNGKSTLMHMIAGLIEPDGGKIVLNGRTLYNSQKKISLPPDRRKVGVVFQHSHLFPHLSVKSNLFYGMNRLPKSERVIEPKRVIDILQLNELLKRNVGRLSGGERQRVALGRTILACPELILLDEPLTGLDSHLKFSIIPQLNAVLEQFEIPMIFISHNMHEMRMMTDEILVTNGGEIDKQCSTEELARTSLGCGGRGYVNLLDLHTPEDLGDMMQYSWGKTCLQLLKGENNGPGRFTLNARDVMLFKSIHMPQARATCFPAPLATSMPLNGSMVWSLNVITIHSLWK